MDLLVEKIFDDVKDPVRAHPDDSGVDVFVHNFERKYKKLPLLINDNHHINSIDNVFKPDYFKLPGEVLIDGTNDVEDILVEDELILNPMERALIGTGIKATSSESGYEIQVRPKSGLALKQGLSIVNTPGTVDRSYTGEIFIILINLSNQPRKIKKGDKIAQLVVSPVLYPSIKIVNNLEETERSDGGFGSTGNT